MEHIVITEALKRGAEVFPNCTCTGSIDMIISINDQHLDCDVKSMTQRQKSRGSVHPITFKVSWHPSLIPEGFESFWD